MSQSSSESFIKNLLINAVFYAQNFPEHITISVDSRTTGQGDIFVALPGSAQDGHQYIAQALEQGAAGLIINKNKAESIASLKPEQLKSLLIIGVDDTLEALTTLAAAWRKQFSYPVVGVTGSVGKTSTKQLLAHIMDEYGMPYLVSFGNQNTLVGICVNIMRMRPEHYCAIFEVGISKRGEMAAIIKVLQPTSGLITTIGHAHMEGLGSVQDIAAEKRMLFCSFNDSNVGIIYGDQPLLAAVSYAHPIIKFGAKTTNQIQARKVEVGAGRTSFILKVYGERYDISLPSSHSGVLHNSLAAIAMAYHLKVPTKVIVDALAKPYGVKGRFEHRSLKIRPGVLIDDCYNANPESMKASLLAFQKMPAHAQKIAVLGDMGELGTSAPFWHRQLGRFLRKVSSVQHVILVGSMVKWMKKTLPINMHVDHVATWQEAQQLLEPLLTDNAVILIKGSRMVGLDNLVTALSI